ncbi:response regulator transcription factor [Pleurocapsa sp. PCC 7319]|uniref:response regulator n=1 Tax=Pleurocapsa sp. PCC 7319 TaxID=118161 RepID=UPI00034DB330|nr:response regulator transcription factor [Pleurocapsa sp. PCC 7319]
MITVLIVDDQKTVQEILRSHLESESSLEIIGCAGDGQEALDQVKMHRPDIVLMDIEMPILDGLTATKIISEQFIDTKVLIISVHNEDAYLNTALQVGAKGYLLKNTPAKEMVNAIYSAYKGYFQLGPGLLENYLHNASKSQFDSQELEQLKSIMLKQSQVLENLGGESSTQTKSRTHYSNGRHRRTSSSRDHLADKYASLEKQLYYLSNRVDYLTRRINFLQQFGVLVILGFLTLGTLLAYFTS